MEPVDGFKAKTGLPKLPAGDPGIKRRMGLAMVDDLAALSQAALCHKLSDDGHPDMDSQLSSKLYSLSPADLLVHSLSTDPDRRVIQFVDSDRTVTAREYAERLSQFVQAIQSLDLGSDVRIGLLSRNRPEVLIINGAVSMLPICMTAMHPMGAIDDLQFIVDDAGLEVLIYDPAYYEDHARQLGERCPGLKYRLGLGPTATGIDLTQLADTFRPKPLVAPDSIDPESIRRLVYSGGTTGRPKAITLSARSSNMLNQIMLSEWEWPEETRHLVCSPLSHGGGAMFFPTMVKRGTFFVLPGFDPTAALEAIQKYRITSTLMVPTMIYALLDHPHLGEYDLSSLEVIYYGASSISPMRLREAIEKVGPVFFQFFGQSEAPMTVCTMKRAEHDPDDLQRLASCGRPVPWVRVSLLDERGEPVAQGRPGEICVQGPLLMSGYLNNPEQTAEAFAGGWLHTGDMAVQDEDGFLRIVDRKKDMVISGGFNVYPREVEDVLTEHPGVAGAAVIGVPHDKWGEAVKAVVVRRPGATVEAAELISLVKQRKGAVQAPKEIEFVDSIPLSGLGKPDKKAVRVLYGKLNG